jgi:sporulation protein YlmC with PRC-barrel domain
MEHVTEELVGHDVVDHEGRPIGEITGVQGDEARLKAETPLAADEEQALSNPEGDLSITAEQITAVDDETVRVSVEQ